MKTKITLADRRTNIMAIARRFVLTNASRDKNPSNGYMRTCIVLKLPTWSIMLSLCGDILTVQRLQLRIKVVSRTSIAVK